MCDIKESNGRTHFKHHSKVLAFRTGKRKCLGEPLAKAQLYLFFTRMMQRYSIVHQTKENMPAESGTGGFINYPKDFKVFFVPRKKMQ